MCLTTKHPCLINVEDVDIPSSWFGSDDDIFNRDLSATNPNLFYHSTVVFNEKFTNQLPKRYKQISTINVRMNFRANQDMAFS